MPKVSDGQLLGRLRTEENGAFALLYKECFPSVAHYIHQNNGNDQDAEDIFQETVIVLLGKIRQSDFQLTASLKTYTFSISKNLWLKKLRDKHPDAVAEPLDFTALPTTDYTTDVEDKILTWLQRITANCQRILKAIFYFNEPMDILMMRMGWKNKHTAANQKYKCLEQMKNESKK